MSRKVFVAGGGMIPFVKPGQNLPYHEMGAEAARRFEKPGHLPLLCGPLTFTRELGRFLCATHAPPWKQKRAPGMRR